MNYGTTTKHSYTGVTASGDLETIKGLRGLEAAYFSVEIANYAGSGNVDVFIDTSAADATGEEKWENRAHLVFAANGDQYVRLHAAAAGSSDGTDLAAGSVRAGPIGEAVKFRATLAGGVTSVDIIIRFYRH